MYACPGGNRPGGTGGGFVHVAETPPWWFGGQLPGYVFGGQLPDACEECDGGHPMLVSLMWPGTHVPDVDGGWLGGHVELDVGLCVHDALMLAKWSVCVGQS